MSTISATDAKNRFGEVLDEAQREPVRIQRKGRDIAVVVSAAEYQRLSASASAPKVSPRVKELHERSVARWDKVYKALAK